MEMGGRHLRLFLLLVLLTGAGATRPITDVGEQEAALLARTEATAQAEDKALVAGGEATRPTTHAEGEAALLAGGTTAEASTATCADHANSTSLATEQAHFRRHRRNEFHDDVPSSKPAIASVDRADASAAGQQGTSPAAVPGIARPPPTAPPHKLPSSTGSKGHDANLRGPSPVPGRISCNAARLSDVLINHCDRDNLISSQRTSRGCCAAILKTVDGGKGCLCAVTSEFEFMESRLSVRFVWKNYKACGGRHKVPKHADSCSLAPPPSPSPPPPSPPTPPTPEGGLSPAEVAGVFSVSVLMAVAAAGAIVLVIRQYEIAALEAVPAAPAPAPAPESDRELELVSLPLPSAPPVQAAAIRPSELDAQTNDEEEQIMVSAQDEKNLVIPDEDNKIVIAEGKNVGVLIAEDLEKEVSAEPQSLSSPRTIARTSSDHAGSESTNNIGDHDGHECKNLAGATLEILAA